MKGKMKGKKMAKGGDATYAMGGKAMGKKMAKMKKKMGC